MNTAFAQQYALVASARGVLLDYCASLRPEHFAAPVAAFNNGTIRDLLVHVAGCYDYWLGQVGLQRPAQTAAAETVTDVAALRARFEAVDSLVADFQQRYAGSWLVPAAFAAPRQAALLQFTPLQLFTHVITHEFHHKGQVLSMSRLLGHTPVDTDAIRT
jgi:uncharacterized damage-inducible protein DinB